MASDLTSDLSVKLNVTILNLKTGLLMMMSGLLLVSPYLSGQSLRAGHDPVYGLDPILYNGEVYSGFIRNVSSGNQYFTGEEFTSGKVWIGGECYEDLALNYDLFNQELLLKYQDGSGAVRIIALSKARIDAFEMEGRHFILVPAEDSTRLIYQLIGNRNTGCLYRWTKSLKLDATYGSGRHYFSPGARQSFVITMEKLTRYRNNRTFIALFPVEDQPLIRRYLHLYRLNVKYADDRDMEALIGFCSNPE